VTAYDLLTRIFLQAIVEKSVLSFRREKEAYKAMPDHNHTGTIWQNIDQHGEVRRLGPGDNFASIGSKLKPGTDVVVLCYSQNPDGIKKSHKTPGGVLNESDLWDFVVTEDDDGGGYIPDVYVFTGDDIDKQLGAQGTCASLQQRL
jgi:hypothetical protein